MPLPEPSNNETKDNFINRCMNDSNIQEEFSDIEQRLGYCYNAWEKRND